MNEPIVASVVEVPRPERPRLYVRVWLPKKLPGEIQPCWRCGMTAYEPTMQGWPNEILAIIPGSADSEPMSDEALREKAEEFLGELTIKPMGVNSLIAFAKSLRGGGA